jgi:DNA polymerase III delta prime subunit
MDILVERFENNALHHAYLLAGNIESLGEKIAAFSDTTLGVGGRSPDYYQKTFDSFGVDDAREIKEMAYLAPLVGERRVFILGIPAITREAQNALLKLLEEPPKHVHFFILAPTVELFLPTVRSRVEILSLGDTGATIDVSAFLSAKIDTRLELVKKITEDKDKAKAAAFLASLERSIADGKGSSTQKTKALAAVLLAERYIRDPGSSVKLLLEHVALSL